MHPWTSPDLRVSDNERKRALRSLSRQHARGRIDADELDERRDAVATARTWGDLAPVFADLAPIGQAPAYRRRRRAPFPFPLLPLLVIAIIVAATGHVPWIAIGIIAAVLVLTAPLRWGHRARWAC
jgi:Flp pilus assembly protein TadB